jgi:hypothetical protein
MTEMNESDEEANVPREPWQRLLEDTGDGPSETTDARIRAAARRDLAPRARRWWLPASLAASFVLAVLVVRSELGTGGRVPVPVPAQRGGESAIDARIIERNGGEQARAPGKSPPAPARQPAKPREETESDVYGYADSGLGQGGAVTSPRVGGPERELKSASEMPEGDVAMDEPSPARIAPPELNATTAAPAAIASPPAPKDWYEKIVALRKAGRSAEADAELAHFKAAYPRWLKEQGLPPP